MLRLFVLLLLLANGAYFAWSQGLLRAYGLAPEQQSEPQRMAQQVRPEAIRVLSPADARKLEAAALAPPARPPECLQAGLFDDVQTAALRQTLEAGLPAGAWSLDPAVEPARWMVYIGKFPTAEALARKRVELAGLDLKPEALTGSALGLGLSLGRFDTQAAANAKLAVLGKRGVRTARVLQERAEVRGSVLRLAAVDDALRARLGTLGPTLAGHPLESCR